MGIRLRIIFWVRSTISTANWFRWNCKPLASGSYYLFTFCWRILYLNLLCVCSLWFRSHLDLNIAYIFCVRSLWNYSRVRNKYIWMPYFYEWMLKLNKEKLNNNNNIKYKSNKLVEHRKRCTSSSSLCVWDSSHTTADQSCTQWIYVRHRKPSTRVHKMYRLCTL